MKFSVLIPVYNVEQYIRECLDSVMNQTFSGFEVVLVDDGSTDGSGEICDEYGRAYSEKIKVIHKVNQGLISARRIAIQNANGDYCLFVDSDDSVEPRLLETIARYLNSDDEIDIVLYSYRYLKDGVKAERYPAAFADRTVWVEESRTELYKTLLFTNQITPIWIKVIRTTILRADPIDYKKYYNRNMAEDLLQSLFPITAAKTICYADAVLYNYRLNTQSISHDYTLDRIKKNDTKHVYFEILDFLPQWGMDSEEYRNKLAARWFHDVMYQFVRCYESAPNGQAREQIMQFDWDSMMPFKAERNPYYSEKYWKIYKKYKDNDTAYLRMLCLKKHAYQWLRSMKRGLLK